MRVAHLILAHTDPAQTGRLIGAMQHEAFDFYIHLDQKADIAGFRFLTGLGRVRFIRNRVNITWGGYSIVRAILRSMDEILNSGVTYRFINLMSAQDYPIKSAQHLYAYLRAHEGCSFLSSSLPDGAVWWKETTGRITDYHFNDYAFRGRFLIQWGLNWIMPARTFPLPVPLYGSNVAMWWTMDVACAQYVVDFMKANPQLDRFLKLTWAADEFLIPTLLMNSPFREQLVNDNLRYIDWSEGNARPKTLRLSDLNSLLQSDKLIARKFDAAIDARVLDEIDAHIRGSVADNPVE